ncbi:MAG: hypothetical protein BHV84_10395 [Prevotella sp. AG:487_50_53]|nr:MAG: hypothetical protein BHV84_10395 [Prevotella sp. AG:487_50_53]
MGGKPYKRINMHQTAVKNFDNGKSRKRKAEHAEKPFRQPENVSRDLPTGIRRDGRGFMACPERLYDATEKAERRCGRGSFALS